MRRIAPRGRIGQELACRLHCTRSSVYHSPRAHQLTGFQSGGEKDPYLWRLNGEGYDGALLCRHGCSFHTQRLHVHPAMTPDGKGVVFTSDMHGYGNIYLVEIPEFESLPPVGPTSTA